MLKQLIAGLLLSCTFGSAIAEGFPNYSSTYQVSITNLTPGQTFTPQLLVTHPRHTRLFTLGEAASVELEILAEGGDTGPLTDSIGDAATDIETIPGLLGPGDTSSISVQGRPGRGRISVAAMLIPTNDTFVALNGVRLPRWGSVSYFVSAYDAGTEANDQNCVNIPGPRCGGEGYSAEASDDDEGFVHIGNGFHDLGKSDSDGNEILKPQKYDWRNTVAKITITRQY